MDLVAAQSRIVMCLSFGHSVQRRLTWKARLFEQLLIRYSDTYSSHETTIAQDCTTAAKRHVIVRYLEIFVKNLKRKDNESLY